MHPSIRLSLTKAEANLSYQQVQEDTRLTFLIWALASQEAALTLACFTSAHLVLLLHINAQERREVSINVGRSVSQLITTANTSRKANPMLVCLEIKSMHMEDSMTTTEEMLKN